MRNTPGRAFLLLSAGVLGACSDATPGLVSPDVATPTASLSDHWNITDVEADFPGLFSFDTTRAGSEAHYYVDPVDDTSGDSERTFCRDHFKPIDLWWDGGYGNMQFHLDPPLLFVGYRTGTYRSPRGLVFRKAVYETFQASEATDPAGNVWRFTGRFNALCRGGELEIGPVVFGGQLLVSQDPVNRPVLVRRGPGSGGDGCGGHGGVDYPTSTAPADTEYALSDDDYDPYYPACGGTGGTGTGGGDGGMTFPEMCSSLGGKLYYDYYCLELWNANTGNYETVWCGTAAICET
jgi:hypothetical protein